jgi:hypothetical protein
VSYKWRAPKSLISPKLGLSHSSCGISGTRGTLPVFSTKGGERGVLKAPGLDQEEGQACAIIQSCIRIQPTSWLKLILHIFSVETSHRRPWTHLTHHGPDSGEATTFPHIVFFATLRHTCIQMVLFLGTPKVESRNCPGLDSRDFGRS